jgi:hypothetical protein
MQPSRFKFNKIKPIPLALNITWTKFQISLGLALRDIQIPQSAFRAIPTSPSTASHYCYSQRKDKPAKPEHFLPKWPPPIKITPTTRFLFTFLHLLVFKFDDQKINLKLINRRSLQTASKRRLSTCSALLCLLARERTEFHDVYVRSEFVLRVQPATW